MIALIAAHDRGAMCDLFVRHNVQVFRFLLRAVGDPGAAEDLLNEVFIDIWRHAGQFEARSKVSTWIFAIAHSRPSPRDGGAPAINSTTTPSNGSRTGRRSGGHGPETKLPTVIRECLELLYRHIERFSI